MNINWRSTDCWLMGEASVGSCIASHIKVLCDNIGVRWAGTDAERAAAEYVAAQHALLQLQNRSVEQFALSTADCHASSLKIVDEDTWRLDSRPCLFCPSIDFEAPVLDVGFGMSHELDPLRGRLLGCIALIQPEFEPFTEPRLLTLRLQDLASAGAVAAITSSPHYGRRLTHISGSDWRDDATSVPLPLIQTSREDAVRLKDRAAAGVRVAVRVNTERRTATSWNTVDASGDMFPFARRGIPSSFLWRWRFVGRHPETAYGHNNADTPDKVRLRELKEYAGMLARLLLRLSHVPAADWPENELNSKNIAKRIEAERGAVFRTI
jgi:hypothetical protein